MPPPIDLTGQRFGKLVVLGRAADNVSASSGRRERAWVCRCDCGRTEIFPARRLPSCASNAARRDAATQCTRCRDQRVCTVCGKTFSSRQPRATCSLECQTLHHRAQYLDSYYRKLERDSAFRGKMVQAQKKLAATDPDYAARLQDRNTALYKRQYARLRANPEQWEQIKSRARELYAQQAEKRRAQAKQRLAERLSAMEPKQYAAWAQRRRERWQQDTQKKRSTPEGRERYRLYMREYLRQQALRGLMAAGDELIKRSINDEH